MTKFGTKYEQTEDSRFNANTDCDNYDILLCNDHAKISKSAIHSTYVSKYTEEPQLSIPLVIQNDVLIF